MLGRVAARSGVHAPDADCWRVAAAYLVNRFVGTEESGGSTGAAPAEGAGGGASWPLRPAMTLAAIEAERPVSEADLMCRLFQACGTSMLPKLKGEFAFVIFDAKTVSAVVSEQRY